jgi:hypothetical protein
MYNEKIFKDNLAPGTCTGFNTSAQKSARYQEGYLNVPGGKTSLRDGLA